MTPNPFGYGSALPETNRHNSSSRNLWNQFKAKGLSGIYEAREAAVRDSFEVPLLQPD